MRWNRVRRWSGKGRLCERERRNEAIVFLERFRDAYG